MGILCKILPRESDIARWKGGSRGERQTLAANVDTVLVTQALGPNPISVDRVVRSAVIARDCGADIAVVLTKADRAGASMLQTDVALIQEVLGQDVRIVATSAGASRRRAAADLRDAANRCGSGWGEDDVRGIVPAGTVAIVNEALTEKYTAIMNQLVKMYKPEGYPQEYIDYYVESNLRQFRSEAEMYGMELEEFLAAAYGVDTDYVKGYFTEAAKALLQQDMILGTIAEKTGISITDEELEEIIAGYAQQYGISVEELKSMSDMTLVRNGQLDTKVLDWLLTVTNVKEVEETEAEFEFDLSFAETEADTEAEVAFIEDTEAE